MVLRLASALVIGSAVNIYIAVAPSILGALVDYQGLPIDVAGRLISYNFWGATVSTILSVTFIHRPGWNLRLTMLACLLIVIVTSGAAVWFAGSVGALAIIRFVNGLGSGLGYTIAALAIVGTPRMEVSFAILYGSPFVIGGVGIALLPYVYQLSGIEGAFYAMAAINLVACAFVPFFPTTVEHASGDQPGDVPLLVDSGDVEGTASSRLDRGRKILSGLVLASLFLHYLFNSGIWTYFERLGVTFGLSPEEAGAWLGPGMAAALFGMLAASVIGNRLGYLRPVYIGTVAIVFATIALLGSSSGLVFGVATGVFNASIPFVTPYFMAILATLIPSGRGVTAGNIVIVTAFALGPYLLSFLVANDEFRPSIILTAVGLAAALGVFVYFARMLRNAPAVYDELKQHCGIAV